MIRPPWTTALTQGEHDLILFAMVATALVLLATLVRGRFTSSESHGTFRIASLTANSVVAITLAVYITMIVAFLLGYTLDSGVYRPNDGARLAWELRYTDWVVTVPLLVLELVSISALAPAVAVRTRRIGMVCAAAMVVCGFLGAFVVAGGTDRTSYVLLGVAGAVFFTVLYALFFGMMRASLPRLPESVRRSYRSAVVLLLVVWSVYPIVYGFVGGFSGGVVVVIAQLALCGADLVAKVGFGGLVHQTSVLRSRNEDSLDPSTVKRPRRARSDMVYVNDVRTIDFDED